MIIVRLLLTTILTISAIYAGLYLWDGIFYDPWTRDAHVRADIVETAPRVSGEITEIAVTNNQTVNRGDILLTIDKTDYELALAQANASRDEAEAQLEIARQQSSRYDTLKREGSVSVSDLAVINADLATKAAEASLKAAEAAMRVAEVNLERTDLRSPVNGIVANLAADTGDFASTGTPVIALVDTDSFRVDAFFLETQLGRIRHGDAARVRFMANGEVVEGRVEGIAPGIAVMEDVSSGLLQAPEPSFQWVRLAQRVPIEIKLVTRPKGIPLVGGATTTVIIEPAMRDERPLWERIWNRDGHRRPLSTSVAAGATGSEDADDSPPPAAAKAAPPPGAGAPPPEPARTDPPEPLPRPR
ncbi:HlyD family secretion protein [Acuticoccus sp. M5D2P5]|uniref:HlyD family secretion protein n=1 Tax=Acuticoccus kalidii TaxID=2910977 RepID=UPI001F1E9FD2|nr:HlyD family secretion protein [Acuticoccus kalidii]MCF3932114.1 HlyD family secretion protein [Acuticoccus kalidii]